MVSKDREVVSFGWDASTTRESLDWDCATIRLTNKVVSKTLEFHRWLSWYLLDSISIPFASSSSLSFRKDSISKAVCSNSSLRPPRWISKRWLEVFRVVCQGGAIPKNWARNTSCQLVWQILILGEMNNFVRRVQMSSDAVTRIALDNTKGRQMSTRYKKLGDDRDIRKESGEWLRNFYILVVVNQLCRAPTWNWVLVRDKPCSGGLTGVALPTKTRSVSKCSRKIIDHLRARAIALVLGTPLSQILKPTHTLLYNTFCQPSRS